MDKLALKKSQMASEKLKKSASKKKKKGKKSAKSDQSPDNLEVEGYGKFETTGLDSDNFMRRQSGSPASNPEPTTTISNDILGRTKLPKSRSSKSLTERTIEQPVSFKPTNTATILPSKSLNDKKISVAFSTYNEIQSITSSLSNMSVKTKTNGTTKSKIKTSSKSTVNGASVVKRDKMAKSNPGKPAVNSKAAEAARLKSEESLRWEFALEDEEQERERIKLYKINRRKRYLAAAQAKGLGWVVNYGNNGFPLVDESVIELRERESLHNTISDFAPVHTIMNGQSTSSMNIGTELACYT